MQLTLGTVLMMVLLPALGCSPNGPTVSLGSNPGSPDAAATADAVALDAVAPDATVQGPVVDAGTTADAGSAECVLTVSPATLQFCAPPGATQQGSVTVTNVGIVDCEILSVSVLGSPAFVTMSPATILAPGAQFVVQILYDPSGVSGDQGVLTISTADADTPMVTVALVGAVAGPLGCGSAIPDAGAPINPDAGAPITPDAGAPPAPCQLAATPAALDLCGPLGARTPGSITVQNVGNATCNILGATLTGSAELTLDTNPAPLALPSGGSATFVVAYQPTDFSADTATFAVLIGGSRMVVPVSAQAAGAVGCP